MPRPRVLVVTDDAVAAEAIRATSMAEGCDVDTAGQATDALERFAQHHYDLLITSLRLRDLDGRRLYWALRARWPLARLRVIFLVRPGEDAPWRDPEAPILPVPFRSELLREMVRHALGLL